jgi:hypothetical protein
MGMELRAKVVKEEEIAVFSFQFSDFRMQISGCRI